MAGVTLEECAQLARKLAERVATELNVPTYCYEAAAFTPERSNLAVCRAGEYEALPEKMGNKDKGPDFGNRPFDEGVARTGATTIGARDFLIAVNYNLNTTSTRRANAIAFDVREKGRPMREGGKVTGKPIKDENGKPINIPGTLKGTKAIGWFIDEYGIAQVSMNITDIATTPLHVAFDEVCKKANERGVRVTGTEIVGLVPKRTLIDAGKHFLRKQHRSVGIPDSEIIRIAVKSMGLDELKPFDPKEKVIEYLVEDTDSKKLIDLTARGLAEETASESPALAAARSPPTWVRSPPPSAPWWPTSPPTKPHTTTVGRNSPMPRKKGRNSWNASSTSLTRTLPHSTESWMCSRCPRRPMQKRPHAQRQWRALRSTPRKCPCTLWKLHSRRSTSSATWHQTATLHQLPTPA